MTSGPSQVLVPILGIVISFATCWAQSPAQAGSGLVLDRGWLTPLQGRSQTLKDLGAVLSPFATPSANTTPFPSLKIFGPVTYLMPYEEAKKALNLNQGLVPKNKVICPGFPKDSFYHYAFDGTFDGHFNKLYLVTDIAAQVVAVQLVAESPIRDQVDAPHSKTDWHTFNFINSRSKALSRLWVEHKPFFQSKGEWREYSPTSPYMQPKEEVRLLRVDSLVIDPGKRSEGSRESDWRPLEAVRLYLPKPMMEVILQVISSTGR